MNQTGGEVILAKDRIGRVRRTWEQKAALLAEYDQSGMSAHQFAAWSGVNYQTLATWLQKRRELAAPAKAGWAELKVQPEPQGLTVQLPGGARLDLKSREDLPMAVELLRMLGC